MDRLILARDDFRGHGCGKGEVDVVLGERGRHGAFVELGVF